MVIPLSVNLMSYRGGQQSHSQLVMDKNNLHLPKPFPVLHPVHYTKCNRQRLLGKPRNVHDRGTYNMSRNTLHSQLAINKKSDISKILKSLRQSMLCTLLICIQTVGG